jgi:hypothetical protein
MTTPQAGAGSPAAQMASGAAARTRLACEAILQTRELTQAYGVPQAFIVRLVWALPLDVVSTSLLLTRNVSQ